MTTAHVPPLAAPPAKRALAGGTCWNSAPRSAGGGVMAWSPGGGVAAAGARPAARGRASEDGHMAALAPPIVTTVTSAAAHLVVFISPRPVEEPRACARGPCWAGRSRH